MTAISGAAARRLTALLTAFGLITAATACSTFSSSGRETYNKDRGGRPSTRDSSSAAPSAVPYDVRSLLHPRRKYFGLASDGAPDSMNPVKAFATMVGKQPNLIEFYSAWGDGFDTGGVNNAWAGGALPYMTWEPKTTSLADIAKGKSDAYIRKVATAVRSVNVPIAISFGHEMNGAWGPWGTQRATAADFTGAWRHIHDLFQRVGATSVIWVWSPNQINITKAPLKPLWPGDSYVDWVGVIGYYGQGGVHSFNKLFGPTFKEVRAFTKRPLLLAETAAPPGARKPTDIKDLFTNVAARSDVIGLIWFNYHKGGPNETDWRVNSSPAAKFAFRKAAADSIFGFDVRHPQ